ncbi:uncharacterized protein LOC106462347 [Limulus polyphemus]|uniref:Uncharacterized protein LOC106462347 n=1 Tax=Limulus polyphemus TaxID=6850 RepID=A0ABM1SNT8_LIMPO|nr:uncharacterized protein LOC106462347 [Limulus polyphemus]
MFFSLSFVIFTFATKKIRFCFVSFRMSGGQDVMARVYNGAESCTASCTKEKITRYSELLLSNQQETASTTPPCLQVFTLDKNFLVSQLENGELCATDGTILKLYGPLQIHEAIAVEQDHLESHNSSNIQQTRITLETGKSDPVQTLLASVQQALLLRLDQLEEKVNNIDALCQTISRRVDRAVIFLKESGPLNRLAIPSKN